MRLARQTIEIAAPPAVVFRYVDDIRNTGWHMTHSSMPMMGGKLALEILSPNPTGVGATYRWHGTVLGLALDFIETVTEWDEAKRRVWHTVGFPRLFILAGYEMSLVVQPAGDGALLTFAIVYDLPRQPFWRLAGWLLAGVYCRWCLNSMCRGAKHALKHQTR
jgi:hypothetical protein